MERDRIRADGGEPVTVVGSLATVAVFVGFLLAASYPAVAGAVALGVAGTLAGQRLGSWLDRWEGPPRPGPAARSGGETTRR
jgi:hypothetical protein